MTHQHVDGEGHDEHGDEEVGDTEAHDEVVGGGLETALTVDTEDDKDVAEEGEEREHDQDKGIVVLILGHGSGGVGRVSRVVVLLQKGEEVPVEVSKH